MFHKFLVYFANLPTTTANTLIVLFTLCVFPTCLSSVTIGQCSPAVSWQQTISSPRSLHRALLPGGGGQPPHDRLPPLRHRQPGGRLLHTRPHCRPRSASLTTHSPPPSPCPPLPGSCACYYLPECLGSPLPETMDDVLYLRERSTVTHTSLLENCILHTDSSPDWTQQATIATANYMLIVMDTNLAGSPTVAAAVPGPSTRRRRRRTGRSHILAQ